MGSKLIDEYPLLVLPTLARAVGLNEAIIVQQVHFWLQNPKVGRWHDNQKWINNTYEEWQRDNFSFWTTRGIRKIFDRLRAENIIKVARLGEDQWDQTLWYTIDYKRVQEMVDALESGSISHKEQRSSSIGNDGSDQGDTMGHIDLPPGDTSLTETTSETTAEITSDFSDGKIRTRQSRLQYGTVSAKVGGRSEGEDIQNSNPDEKDLPKQKSTLHARIALLIPGPKMSKVSQAQLDQSVKTSTGTDPSPNEAYEKSPIFRAWLEAQVFPYFQTLNETGPRAMKHVVNLIRASYERGPYNYYEYRKLAQADQASEQTRKQQEEELRDKARSIPSAGKSYISKSAEKLARGELDDSIFDTDDSE